jgi:hypothetical protein
MSDQPLTIAVDLDGTLAHYSGWKGYHCIGDPLPGAVDVCRTLVEAGHTLFVYTCRCCDAPIIGADGGGEPFAVSNPAVSESAARHIQIWLRWHGFPLMTVWTGPGKPFADVYLDDRAFRIEPMREPGAWWRFLEAVNAGGLK